MTFYSRKRGIVSIFDSVNMVYCRGIRPNYAENNLRSEQRVCYSTEFETHEATSRLEYTIGFRKNLQTSNIMIWIMEYIVHGSKNQIDSNF